MRRAVHDNSQNFNEKNKEKSWRGESARSFGGGFEKAVAETDEDAEDGAGKSDTTDQHTAGEVVRKEGSATG